MRTLTKKIAWSHVIRQRAYFDDEVVGDFSIDRPKSGWSGEKARYRFTPNDAGKRLGFVGKIGSWKEVITQ